MKKYKVRKGSIADKVVTLHRCIDYGAIMLVAGIIMLIVIGFTMEFEPPNAIYPMH